MAMQKYNKNKEDVLHIIKKLMINEHFVLDCDIKEKCSFKNKLIRKKFALKDLTLQTFKYILNPVFEFVFNMSSAWDFIHVQVHM